MKEKDTKRKVSKIDLEALDNNQIIQIDRSMDFHITYQSDTNVGFKKELAFIFQKNNLSSNIFFRSINDKPITIELKLVIIANEGVTNVSSVLDMRALLLDENASMTFVPSLEIDEKEVSVDHKSTIGRISEKWLSYLASRGLTQPESIRLVKQSFLEI